jgi:hypothetical protein
MPYLTDKQKLDNYFIDGRTKMLPCQKERCIALYEEGTGIRALSRMFNVSRRLIQFLLFPERKEKNLQDREERGGTMKYYDKDYHKFHMKKHRAKKHKILKPC